MENLIMELSVLNHKIEKGEANINDIASVNFNNITNSIMYSKADEEVKKNLVGISTKLIKLYFDTTGEDLITDEEYDKLHEIYVEYFGKSLGGTERGGQISHQYPRLRGTTHKIHFITDSDKKNPDDPRKSYVSYLDKQLKKLPVRPVELRALVSLKIDGISAIAECDSNGKAYQVLKRGDTDNDRAEDIPALRDIIFSRTEGETFSSDVGIKMEIAMTDSAYKEYTKKWSAKTPRSAVTSICNSDNVEVEKLQYLTFYTLQRQVNGTDKEEPYYWDDLQLEIDAYDFDELRAAIDRLFDIHLTFGIPADGVVVRLLGDDIQDQLGREDNVNNYEVAYKFPAGEAETIINDVVFQLGLLGGITPVAKIEPVNINGTVISSPGLGSVARFKQLNLMYGQKVNIRHDVVPYLDPIVSDNESGLLIPLIDKCPVCNTKLTEKGEELQCTNSQCAGLVRGSIINFCEKVDMGSLSIGTVNDFFEAGYLRNLSDIYKLKDYRKELENLPNYGKRSVQEVLDAVESKRVLKDHIFLGALGIKGVARTKFATILNKVSFNGFFNAVYDLSELNRILSPIKGVGDKIIMAIYEHFRDNREVIQELKSQVEIVTGKSTVQQNAIHVLFTKVRDKELEEEIESDGHIVDSRYTKETDIVIVPYLKDKNNKPISSSKVDKAIKDGKLIIDVDTFRKEYKKFMSR